MDLFSTYFSSSFLEPCPKLVLSDHSATNTQLAYDFLLHRRKLMMSIYHQLRASALYNFHSSELPTRTLHPRVLTDSQFSPYTSSKNGPFQIGCHQKATLFALLLPLIIVQVVIYLLCFSSCEGFTVFEKIIKKVLFYNIASESKDCPN